MTCRIVTQARHEFNRRPSHVCGCKVVRDGLCKVHLKQRDSLPRRIERHERKAAELRALLASMTPEPAPENPS